MEYDGGGDILLQSLFVRLAAKTTEIGSDCYE